MQDITNRLIEFIEENQDKLYRIAFSYVKNEDLALDIVQESIEKALRNIKTLKHEEYVKTWFYRILINESLGYIRRNKNTTLCQVEDLKDDIEWNDNITIEGIDLYNNIGKLKEKLRTVIILRFFEDLKIEEIARITKTSPNTVKSRLYKGLEELKKLIKM
mgnify:FL=1